MVASPYSAEQIRRWVVDARQRTLDLVCDLTDEQLRVPLLEIINPYLWEIGHIAWFQEKWVLRHVAGEAAILPGGDALYDSSAVAHDTRWDLRLPSRQATLDYLGEVLDRVVRRLRDGNVAAAELDFHLLALSHEDMHGEAFTYTRQTLGYPAPRRGGRQQADRSVGDWAGDAAIPGGRFCLGAAPEGGHVLDNEQWAHPVDVEPFSIARAPVTQEAFAGFVDAGGYRDRSFWSDAGWDWRTAEAAECPIYFRRVGRGWERRDFDRGVPLEPHRPVIHVNWYEANAYCRWAGRRLPDEVEWEVAAAAEPTPDGRGLRPVRRRLPWGDEPPTPDRANLDGDAGGTVDVAARGSGDSAFGCRQMLGNVWEWTATDFRPYPGFTPGPYREYSEPWFGTRKVLRGGAWATRGRMLRNTWRNFFTPERRDVFAGFRTCSLDRPECPVR